MPHVEDPAHLELERLSRKKLGEAGWHVLPEITYHAVLGGQSDNAWALRHATGAIAAQLRSLPDIVAISPKGKAFSIDCKTNSGRKYRSASFEALPVAKQILRTPGETAYIYRDTISKAIRTRALLLDKLIPQPKALFLTGRNKDNDLLAAKLCQKIWPNLPLIDCPNYAGSGDSFLVFTEDDVKQWPTPSALIEQLAGESK